MLNQLPGNHRHGILRKDQISPLIPVYPTALKGCWGIVFNHGVRMGGWLKKFVWPVSQKL